MSATTEVVMYTDHLRPCQVACRGPHREVCGAQRLTLRGVHADLVGVGKAVRKQQVTRSQSSALACACGKARRLAHVSAERAEVLQQSKTALGKIMHSLTMSHLSGVLCSAQLCN